MNDILPIPADKIWDALDLYEKEIKCWRIVPDQSSQYNDNGTLRYIYCWLIWDSPAPINVEDIVDETYVMKRYHHPMELAQKAIKLKAMEKVMETFLCPQ
jgi:hypothetical protein